MSAAFLCAFCALQGTHMAIISTQNKKKFSRSYCRHFLLAASILAAFLDSPSVAQADTSAPVIQKAASHKQSIWINPFTNKRVYLDSSWRVSTNYAGDQTTSLIDDASIRSQLGVMSTRTSEDLQEYVTHLLRINDGSDFIFYSKRYFNIGGESVWFASGLLAKKPGRAFCMILKKDGNYIRGIVSSYPDNKEMPSKLNQLSSKILESFY